MTWVQKRWQEAPSRSAVRAPQAWAEDGIVGALFVGLPTRAGADLETGEADTDQAVSGPAVRDPHRVEGPRTARRAQPRSPRRRTGAAHAHDDLWAPARASLLVGVTPDSADISPPGPQPGRPGWGEDPAGTTGTARNQDADDQLGQLGQRPAGELLKLATASLTAGLAAHLAGDNETAETALLRCGTVARSLQLSSPERPDGWRLQADSLYQLAAVQLATGRADQARAGLDAAEALYSQLGAEARSWVADTRARRAGAHAAAGRGLSALVDAQAAVLHHVQALDLAGPQQARLGLAGALTSAAAVQADHGGSELALTAAQQAIALLLSIDGAISSRNDLGVAQVRVELVRALDVEIRMLRALGRMPDLAAPIEALSALTGIEHVRQLLDGPSPGARPGLPAAARHDLVDQDVRDAVTQLLSRPLSTVSVPGLLVEPAMLLEAARQGAVTAVALAQHDPQLALAAGRDAACLYACAEELGLVEHPWPQVRVELARWMWLLSELGWLACSMGDHTLARDLAGHAEHPLVRAESGRHLPEAIARSLAESAARLRQLHRTAG